MKFLIGNSIEASKLRNTYVFKLVPMLNPDGVILGNTRCSLAGQDLNRQWKTPSMHRFPEIYSTKEVITKNILAHKENIRK